MKKEPKKERKNKRKNKIPKERNRRIKKKPKKLDKVTKIFLVINKASGLDDIPWSLLKRQKK